MIPDYATPILEADAHAYIKRMTGWPYAGMATESNRWARRKYYFALEIWAKRELACPGFNCTWATRFEQMWHESLDEYRERLHSERDKQVAA